MTNHISMSGIARLAGVARTTVSMWRKRFGVDSDSPFPTPLSRADFDASLIFDAAAVA